MTDNNSEVSRRTAMMGVGTAAVSINLGSVADNILSTIGIVDDQRPTQDEISEAIRHVTEYLERRDTVYQTSVEYVEPGENHHDARSGDYHGEYNSHLVFEVTVIPTDTNTVADNNGKVSGKIDYFGASKSEKYMISVSNDLSLIEE